MDARELKEGFDDMEKEGYSKEQMLNALFEMFQGGKIDVNVLGEMAELLGYQLSDDFKNLSPEEQKTVNQKGEDKEDLDEPRPATPQPDSKEEEDDDDEEEDEEARANKLFGFDK